MKTAPPPMGSPGQKKTGDIAMNRFYEAKPG